MAFRVLRSGLRLVPAAVEVAAGKATAVWSSPAVSSSSCLRRHFQKTRPHYALLDVIQKELEYEKKVARDSEDPSALDSPPGGWELAAKANDTTMKLSKTVGSESIVVEISTLDQDQMDDEPEEGSGDEEGTERQYAINFHVDCSKGSEKLRFSMMFVEDDKSGPVLEHVGLVPAGVNEMEMSSLYTGPTYEELDQDAQSGFEEYLRERGVDSALGQYLCQLVYDKEQRDYEGWLGRVSNFLKK